jgi:GT2 family glycosyltransferase
MYGEEMELCYRIRASGCKVIFDPAIGVVHYGEGSWRGDAIRPILLRQLAVIYFYRKHYRGWWPNFASAVILAGSILRSVGWLIAALVSNRTSRRRAMDRARLYGHVFSGIITQLLKPTASRGGPGT